MARARRTNHVNTAIRALLIDRLRSESELVKAVGANLMSQSAERQKALTELTKKPDFDRDEYRRLTEEYGKLQIAAGYMADAGANFGELYREAAELGVLIEEARSDPSKRGDVTRRQDELRDELAKDLQSFYDNIAHADEVIGNTEFGEGLADDIERIEGLAGEIREYIAPDDSKSSWKKWKREPGKKLPRRKTKRDVWKTANYVVLGLLVLTAGAILGNRGAGITGNYVSSTNSLGSFFLLVAAIILIIYLLMSKQHKIKRKVLNKTIRRNKVKKKKAVKKKKHSKKNPLKKKAKKKPAKKKK